MHVLRALFATALLGSSCAAWALQSRDPLPAVVLANGQGEQVALQSLRGRVLLVDFWASWCVPCRQSFPFLNRLHARYEAQGLSVIGINVGDAPADATKFLKQVPSDFQILFDLDGITPTQFGVVVMPTSYLISRDGKISSVHRGFKNSHQETLERAVREALAEPGNAQ